MDTPKDICTKYCSQRLQRLTEDKPCSFKLVSSSVENKGAAVHVRTVCEGFLETGFKTIIERISKSTKLGVQVLKEIIKHEIVKPEFINFPTPGGGTDMWKQPFPFPQNPMYTSGEAPKTWTMTVSNTTETTNEI